MSEWKRLLPFKGKDAPPDPAWQNALFVAQTQAEVDAALALKETVTASVVPLEFGDKPGHDFHGNQWTGQGAGTQDDPIRCSSASLAAQLISEGKFVQLPPEKVSILLDKLADLAKEAKAQGKAAPNYDLCKITVPDSNLFCAESKGIARIDMPQLSGQARPGSTADTFDKDKKGEVNGVQAFKDQLRADGHKFEDVEVKASHLKATQNELNGAKVAGMMKSLEDGKLPKGRIFVSNDNYVLDGHHRWAAVVGENYDGKKVKDLSLDVTRVNLPISVLLPYAKGFAAGLGIQQAAVASAMISDTVAVSATLSILSRFERAELYAEDQPRDEQGQWTTGDGLPRFKDSVADPVKFLSEGKAGYIKLAGMAPPAAKDWSKVMSDPHFGGQVADHYSQLPMYDKNAEPAYNQLAKEVDAQYAYLTQTMGVKVDVMDHDPYTTVQQLRDDLEQNHHLGVLATEVTGSHPYLSDTQNDHFRAVHDAFGHAAIGRGFDRNGEEAAFQSHAQMFSSEATRALASETRGQNNAMIYGKYPEGTFPPQKFALLPAEDSLVKPARTALAAGGVPGPTADDDNLYDVTHVHHASLGRRLPAATASVEEFYSADQPRDERGRFGEGGSGTYVTRYTRDTNPALGTGDANATKFALGQANQYASDVFIGYQSASEWGQYADTPKDKEGEPVVPKGADGFPTWQPGSVAALSESISQWQNSFANSANMQVAADGLMGHGYSDQAAAANKGSNDDPAAHGSYEPFAAAMSRELLNAMAGNGPEGAASASMVTSYSSDTQPTAGVHEFGAGELARGIDDPTGSIVQTFKDAQSSGAGVGWSIASFVEGNGGATRVMDFQENEMGGGGATRVDPNTGESVPLTNPNDYAVATALQYTKDGPVGGGSGDGVAPVVIRTTGTGLSIDGGYEAVVGGTFAVDNIHTATADERDSWGVKSDIPPITVVDLHQTANVQLPDGVAITAGADVPVIWIPWRDGSVRARAGH